MPHQGSTALGKGCDRLQYLPSPCFCLTVFSSLPRDRRICQPPFTQVFSVSAIALFPHQRVSILHCRMGHKT
ncbi:hypothetical protein [Phormidium sp. CCY1219]|uniref:hypothetical protein n=1 Tax=Phormidium sp. CCY1219 TaxID=2886104 RepID=UPI002D1EF1DC|nr:hypothetical protein [Phormidium sp. CCY1219]MEB3827150.1 hypothetical protein [Phormidium sp. CCY1219]